MLEVRSPCGTICLGHLEWVEPVGIDFLRVEKIARMADFNFHSSVKNTYPSPEYIILTRQRLYGMECEISIWVLDNIDDLSILATNRFYPTLPARKLLAGDPAPEQDWRLGHLTSEDYYTR